MGVYELACRALQAGMCLVRNIWSRREPRLLEGPGSVNELPALVKSLGLRRVLLVTDPGLMKLGLPAPLIAGFEKAGLYCAVYAKTQANPTLDNIKEARRLYAETNCEAVAAFGGGSSMDCGKMVCFLTACPRRKPEKIKGVQLARLRTPPPLFAVPTTAGTGSEATIAAVVTDDRTRAKYTVTSPLLRPKYAVLDPALTLGLPPAATAQTGLDALTRAVEAYVSRGRTKNTDARALEAVRLVFDHLEAAYEDGQNAAARQAMLAASYRAGAACTRACAGYAQGIAHALGGLYGLPHGLACAVALPHVLAACGQPVQARLARLAEAVGADDFVQALRDMNTCLGIPAHFDCIREEDVPAIAARAVKECNPLCPVPVIWRQGACEEVVRGMMGQIKR